jgi:hypothetical protein
MSTPRIDPRTGPLSPRRVAMSLALGINAWRGRGGAPCDRAPGAYDLKTSNTNHRTYLRSMLERFGWTRLGSVFRYDGRHKPTGSIEEDWLNDVAPALMFFRSYLLKHRIQLKFFTLDTFSVSRLDHSDAIAPLGTSPLSDPHLNLLPPSNPQSSEKTIRSSGHMMKFATGRPTDCRRSH